MKNKNQSTLFNIFYVSVFASTLLISFLQSESKAFLSFFVILTILILYFSKLIIKDSNKLNEYFNFDRTLVPIFTIVTLVITFYFYNSPFVLLMLCTILLYSIVSLGLTLQFGYTGIINFAAAAFFGIGGYTTAVLSTYNFLPSFIIILLSGLISLTLSSILLFPILKTKGHYAALITIAAGLLFRNFLEVNDTLGGPQGLQIPSIHLFNFDFNNPILFKEIELSFYIPYVLLILFIFICFYLFIRRIEKSWIGITLDSIRTDETSSSTFGISVVKWKTFAFLVGNFIIGVAGSIYASVTGFIAPNNFTFSDSLVMISIMILAGVGNIKGIIPAALIMILIPEKLQFIQEYRFLISSLLIIAILLFRPNGLFPRSIRKIY